MICVVARHGTSVTRFPLPRREARARLGSGVDCEIHLPFAGVSRLHARIEVADGEIALVDAGSKNGLVVDRQRRERVVLVPGLEVHLGRVAVSLEEGPSSDVELGLPRGVAASTPTSRETDDEARAATEDAAGKDALLELVERLDGDPGLDRPSVLARAVEVLGCESLLSVRRSEEGELVLLEICGPLPEPDLLDRLLMPPSPGSSRDEVDDVRVLRALDRRAGGAELAAFFPRSGPAPAEWHRRLFRLLGRRLCGPGEEAPGPPPVPVGQSLNVPRGMVIGRSPAMTRLVEEIGRTLDARCDVLLLGETGTGKELFANMIHGSGPRRDGPFVAINCAAIPSELLEAELFGVQGRVATGVDPRTGHFVRAHGGTILLDEVGDLALPLQAKLLRVLQEREVLPVGAPAARKIDIRILSASNRDLQRDVREGRFREDLFHRLGRLTFRIPPLRERKPDLASLIVAVIQKVADEERRARPGVSRRALEILLAHHWPGNFRELENVLRRAVLTCPAGGVLDSAYFAEVGGIPGTAASGDGNGSGPVEEDLNLRRRLEELEWATILRALSAAAGNRSLAAKLLGVTRNGLAMKIARHKLGERERRTAGG